MKAESMEARTAEVGGQIVSPASLNFSKHATALGRAGLKTSVLGAIAVDGTKFAKNLLKKGLR
jgi:hypothetical protein